MTRKQHYGHNLDMEKRLYELAEIHGWTMEELQLAAGFVHEQPTSLPFNLHFISM